MGTLHEYKYTFLIISHSVLLGMKNLSDKSCRENQNTHFMFNTFFFNHAVYEIMWKNIVESGRYRWQYGACTLHAGYVRLQMHT
jgi:hypothetical protein